MTCTTGDRSCETPRRRGALVILVIMAGIFIGLSIFSFRDSRGQVTPAEFDYNNFTADQGKKIFQAYNCMGCHTIVGNGAYLGPDLTNIYEDAGPAWLEAFLPSAGSWPTAAAVRTHLITPEQLAAAGVESLDGYLAKYPGAAARIERRGGATTQMPNLPFTQDEVDKLIAFFKYTSAMNTEGWPPAVKVGNLEQRLQLAYGSTAAVHAPVAVPVSTTTPTPATGTATAEIGTGDVTTPDPAKLGAQLVASYGCTACHATDNSRMVGPGWGGLYGNQVTLADGSTITVDETYLAESIREPNTHVAEGYPAGVMPAYGELLKDEEVNAIVAYLVSLNSAEKQ